MNPDVAFDYPWLAEPLAQLRQAYDGGRFHHALLLNGAPGMGKSALCQYLAKTVLCDAAPGLYACGRCKSCHLVKAGNHPDWCSIDNAELSIGIDEIRKAGEFVHKRPNIAKARVITILGAEQMTEAASNALLKTLEEPAKNVYLLLSCNALSRLLPTILSRCHKLTIQAPDRQQSIAYLQSFNGALNHHQCDILLQLASNAPLKVTEWLKSHSLDALNQAEQQYFGWRQGQLAPSQYASFLGQSDFAFLLFGHLLKQDMTQKLAQGGADNEDLLASFSAITHAVAQYRQQHEQVKGQNQQLALLRLINQVSRLL